MNFKVSKDTFLAGLQRTQAIVTARPALPILSNVLLEAEGGRLRLTTTDMEVSVRTDVEAEVESGGGTTLPARKLLSIFRELPNREIEIDVDERDVASIRCGSALFKLVGISEEDFPPLPQFEAARTYTLDCGAFQKMLQKTAYAASTDETRYVLNGVLLSFQGEKLIVVATDGRRLALVEQEVEFPQEAEADLILPSKTVQELIKTLPDEGELTIRATENQIQFEFGDMLVVSKLIEGTYPNFRQVIPAQSEQRIALAREEVLAAARRVALMTDDQSNSIKLTFDDNQLELVTTAPEMGEARETVPVKYDGEALSIAFNPEFFMQPLRTLDADEVFIEVTDELSPGVIKTSIPFLYVIMPLRLT